MTRYDNQRLNQAIMQFDIDGIRRGRYSDKYFVNVVRVLEGAARAGYRFEGTPARDLPPSVNPHTIDIGNLIVEAQVFSRRAPRTLVAGIDGALAMLRHATGYWDGERYVETWDALDVEAVQDGDFAPYAGDPEEVCPVLKIRGRYRDFALLETTILGVLTRASRIATNVYEAMEVSAGKPILFFPARFDLPQVQALDGYAYFVGVQAYNHVFGQNVRPAVSTDAQAEWWGGRGGGTVPHALIAAFMGDTAEAMVAFARFVPPDVPRIVLADFNNDVVGASLETLDAYFPRYAEALAQGDMEAMRRWTLMGVRLDTSANVRDKSLGEGDPMGVNPKMVRLLRQRLDEAWQRWDLPESLAEVAMAYCRNVKIAVSGGFNRERIAEFEADGVPVDIYGLGSSLLRNDRDTNTDFTMDVVRVQVDGQWVEMAKIGRRPNDNPQLEPINLAEF